MKRSKSIQLTLLASTAALLTSCGSGRPPRRCVDGNDKVVDEHYCRDESHPVGFYPYRWYYGGPRGFVPIGGFLSGGSGTPPRGGYSTPAADPSGTSRGVIGGAGAAASGAHGEGGGE